MNHAREARILEQLIGPTFFSAMEAHNGYVAGGAIRAVFSSEPILDVDIFFHSKEDFDACFSSFGEQEYSPTFSVTDSAATHVSTGEEDGGIPKMRYQLISAEYGPPDALIRKFDFTMCMGAFHDGRFILDSLFLKHIAQRRLCYNANGKYPICSLWRAAKFIKRGWKLPGIEAIKLALAINNVGIKDFADLKEQLLGIDTMFLAELTSAIAQNSEKRYDFGEAIDFIGNFLDQED